jgi:hypothetical protein
VEETDQLLFASTQLRYGVTDTIEARLGWTPVGYVRTHDRIAHEIDHDSGVGDITFGFKANLIGPDGSGPSLALLPYAIAPTGQRPIGAGDWGAGLLVPVAVPLGDRFDLALTPEVDAAVDDDGEGRHLAVGGAGGLDLDLTDHMSIGAEVAVRKDQDPGGHLTQTSVGLSAAWRFGEDWQLDLGSNFGADHSTPDVEVYAGITRRF